MRHFVGNPKSLCEFLNDVRDLGPFHRSTSALVSWPLVIMLAPHGHKDFKAWREKGLKAGARGTLEDLSTKKLRPYSPAFSRPLVDYWSDNVRLSSLTERNYHCIWRFLFFSASRWQERRKELLDKREAIGACDGTLPLPGSCS